MKATTFLLFLLMDLVLGRVSAQSNEAVPPEKRLALVVGNSAYSSGSVLPTAVNDATDMAATLKQLGFEVMFYTDLSKRNLRKAMDDFGAKLKGYQVSLFFYSGHGVSLADQTYLVPIDASAQRAGDIEFDCFPVNQVLTKMNDAKTNTSIVVLDADRNNPTRTNSMRGSSSGLPAITGTSSAGLFIAYATAPGQSVVASTGRNGVYTGALLKNLKSPGLPIEEIFKRTRIDVQKETNNCQYPWDSSLLTQEFYFRRQ